jgi:serine/threonine protein kinase
MAPEVFEIAKNEIDSGAVQLPEIAHPFKADVYSFALVCYEILTGKQPFEGERMGELLKRITIDRLRPELPEQCPTRLAFLIQRCWEHDPCERPDFPEICRELRYIKGLLLTGLSTPLIAHPFKADVYSFALVCYEMLTGEQPFEGEKMGDLFKRITVDRLRPELPDECPSRLASLIRRCWEHDPRERPNLPEIWRELRYMKGLLLTG